MQKETTSTQTRTEFNDHTDFIVDCIQDIKGKNIVKLDLRKLDGPADYFIVCEGESTTQVNAIAGNIQKRMKYEMDQMPIHVEGKGNSTWVLVDYFDIVVHIFYPETRRFYEIEQLWSDAITTEYQNI